MKYIGICFLGMIIVITIDEILKVQNQTISDYIMMCIIPISFMVEDLVDALKQKKK